MNPRKEQIIQLLKDAPSEIFLHYALAIEEEKDGDLMTAIEILESIKKAYPQYEGTYLKLSQLYETLEKNEEATAVANMGISVAQRSGNKKMEQELRQFLLNLI